MWAVMRKTLTSTVTICGLMWSLSTPAQAGETVVQVLQSLSEARSLRLAKDAPAIPAEAYTQAASGEWVTGVVEVEGESGKKGWGVAVLDVPLARMWAAVVDESHQADYLPTSIIEVVEGASCQSGRQVFQYLPVNVPLTSDRWWVVQRDHNEALQAASGGRMRELYYHTTDPGPAVAVASLAPLMEEGVQLEVARGSWMLTALDDGRTLVEYYAWSKPGGRMSPGLASMFAGKSIGKAFEGMLAWSKDGRLGCL